MTRSDDNSRQHVELEPNVVVFEREDGFYFNHADRSPGSGLFWEDKHAVNRLVCDGEVDGPLAEALSLAGLLLGASRPGERIRSSSSDECLLETFTATLDFPSSYKKLSQALEESLTPRVSRLAWKKLHLVLLGPMWLQHPLLLQSIDQWMAKHSRPAAALAVEIEMHAELIRLDVKEWILQAPPNIQHRVRPILTDGSCAEALNGIAFLKDMQASTPVTLFLSTKSSGIPGAVAIARATEFEGMRLAWASPRDPIPPPPSLESALNCVNDVLDAYNQAFHKIEPLASIGLYALTPISRREKWAWKTSQLHITSDGRLTPSPFHEGSTLMDQGPIAQCKGEVPQCNNCPLVALCDRFVSPVVDALVHQGEQEMAVQWAQFECGLRKFALSELLYAQAELALTNRDRRPVTVSFRNGQVSMTRAPSGQKEQA